MAFPREWSRIIADKLGSETEHPSGRWSDFNCYHLSWDRMDGMPQIVYPADLPDEPDPTDYYEDLVTPRQTELCGDCENCD